MQHCWLARLTPHHGCARVGAPSFLGVILVVWGGVTLLFAFMRTAGQFYFLRLLLGVAESGAYPGVSLPWSSQRSMACPLVNIFQFV